MYILSELPANSAPATTPPALAALAQYKQFILWRKSTDANGKVIKHPAHPHGFKVHDAHDRAAWVSAAEAYSAAEIAGPDYGVAFVLTANDPFFCLDIDNARLNASHLKDDAYAWSELAKQLCTQFNGAAIEQSVSGNGLHIWGQYSAPFEHAKRNSQHHIELYTDKRFIALGTPFDNTGVAGAVCDSALSQLVTQYFPPKVTATAADWSNEPVADWCGPASDTELVTLALEAQGSVRQVFGGAASFRDLYEANADVLADAYPPDNINDAFNHSLADMALCSHLAFWTGKNCDRIDRIFRQSELYRDKWERDDYRQNTVLTVVAGCDNAYNSPKYAPPVETVASPAVASPPVTNVAASTAAVPPPTTSDVEPLMGRDLTPRYASGLQFLSVEQQFEAFKGFVYVEDERKIMTPQGRMVDQSRFNDRYGGFIFALSADGQSTTKNAWDAFVKNQGARFPKVDTTEFRPEYSDGHVWERDGETFVNSYVEVNTPRLTGDASKFYTHLQKLFPDDNDRHLFLSYMAACIQLKGKKFQWSPFVQGVEGNGKTLFSKCVAFAISGRYSHAPRAENISKNFNSWYRNRIFIYVEDIYVPESKREVYEIIKPMITNTMHAVEPKGIDEKMTHCPANWLVNSNHQDGYRKSPNDRRVAPFFTPQQDKSDLARDGMPRGYFTDLYDWLNGEGSYAGGGENYGYRIVNDVLHTHELTAGFKQLLFTHAPETTSTEASLAESAGKLEQLILEAIDQREYGLDEQLITGRFAFDYLRNSGEKISPQMSAKAIRSMGYKLAPQGSEGKITINSKTHKFYIKKGSPLEKYTLDKLKEYWKENCQPGQPVPAFQAHTNSLDAA